MCLCTCFDFGYFIGFDMEVDGEDLLFRKNGFYKKIGCIKMRDRGECDFAFFLKFAHHALDGAFAKFQATSW